MHECILKLIRTSKPESMEDHLECLCKLLTTIGKDLDHRDAKVSLFCAIVWNILLKLLGIQFCLHFLIFRIYI